MLARFANPRRSQQPQSTFERNHPSQMKSSSPAGSTVKYAKVCIFHDVIL
jgi:hypothetical protein